MKELSIEEKARAYDEAIEKIKYVMEHGVQPVLTKEDLRSIFPEIFESEDEKIRKTIIRFFKDQYSNETEMYDGSVTVGKAIAWLENQGQVKESPIFLLQKMPSCITVDGIDYHFVMKKTSIYIAYYACYKGNGEEGRGNAIFGITAHSPIDLLTEMLEILKEKGLLE